MKLDLSFEQNQQNINVPFAESGGQFNANFGETSVLHDGQNGATFTPFVSSDGIISWTNDRGLQNPPPVNIKGDKGKKGDKGDTGANGKDGVNGKDGANGRDGKDGYTPINGVDYFTDADKAEMVTAVIAALPHAEGVGF